MKPHVRKAPGGSWTATRPAYGFGPLTVTRRFPPGIKGWTEALAFVLPATTFRGRPAPLAWES